MSSNYLYVMRHGMTVVCVVYNNNKKKNQQQQISTTKRSKFIWINLINGFYATVSSKFKIKLFFSPVYKLTLLWFQFRLCIQFCLLGVGKSSLTLKDNMWCMYSKETRNIVAITPLNVYRVSSSTTVWKSTIYLS